MNDDAADGGRTMEVVIVTGASRGLGAALVSALLSPERLVIAVARTANPELEQEARAAGAWLDWYLQDLADAAGCEALARSICTEIPRDAARYTLINNAGVLTAVGRIEDLGAAELDLALGVNVAAAMLFAAQFTRATADLAADKRVINISSGAARKPYEGWSAYSTTKAALDMFTRVQNLEQGARAHPLRAVSLAPGVVDTSMQAQLRAQDSSAFPEVQRFRDLKASGQLASPADAARRIVAYLARADFGTHEIDDLRNY